MDIKTNIIFVLNHNIIVTRLVKLLINVLENVKKKLII